MIYWLPEDQIVFPHPNTATEDGVLALGGDLSPARVLFAYQHGIFPWFNDEDPIIWWSPNPRFVLYPDKLKVSKSLVTWKIGPPDFELISSNHPCLDGILANIYMELLGGGWVLGLSSLSIFEAWLG